MTQYPGAQYAILFQDEAKQKSCLEFRKKQAAIYAVYARAQNY